MTDNTKYSHLGIRIAAAELHVMIYDPLTENSLVVKHFPLDPDDHCKSLEEIVYDNPDLLGEFAKRRIVIETPDFTLLPSAIDDPDTRRAILDRAVPDRQGPIEMIVNDFAPAEATFLTAVPQAEINFLRRTFDNPAITLNQPLLCRYYAAQVTPGSVKTFVNLRADSADVTILGPDRLLLANRFRFKAIDDIAYYILASFDALKIAPTDILVTGNRDLRETLLKQLREFCPNVMALIFPSAMYRAGKIAMNSPFDLIILPLCE